MHRAYLFPAQMQEANLIAAQMQEAKLSGARMQGANLRKAEMSEDTALTAAGLRGAAVSAVDDTTLAQLQPFLPEMFADGSITLPEGTPRPDHWVSEDSRISDIDFDRAWRAWQDTLSDFPDAWKVQLD